jgi:hypothetical protein
VRAVGATRKVPAEGREGGVPMKASYVIHRDRRFVDEVVHGPVTRNKLSTFFSSVFSDPHWDPTFDGVLDFTSATVEMGYMDAGIHSDFMIFRERSAALAWIKGSAILV